MIGLIGLGLALIGLIGLGLALIGLIELDWTDWTDWTDWVSVIYLGPVTDAMYYCMFDALRNHRSCIINILLL